MEDVADPADQPVSITAYRVSGGVHDGQFVIEFDFRNDDPSLVYTLEATSVMGPPPWPDAGSVVLDEAPVPGRPANRRVIKPDEPMTGERYFRVRFGFDDQP